MPSQPASAIARWNSCGKLLSPSLASQYSSPKPVHRCDTAVLISCCSAVSAKVIAPQGSVVMDSAPPQPTRKRVFRRGEFPSSRLIREALLMRGPAAHTALSKRDVPARGRR